MSGDPPAEEPTPILLVDDRPSNLLSLRAILERPDYRLVTASSGPEALGLVLKDDFSVILLDVAMPGMDGFEVATLLKQRARFRGIPIIFVTASVQDISWIFRAYSVGAVDFLNKPLDPHSVRAKVSVFVELYRQKRELARHAAVLQELERREHEREVERLVTESERRYLNLAEAIPHVVWTADASGGIRYFNRRWFELTGRNAEASLGDAWREAVHPDDAAALAARRADALQAGVPLDTELRLRQVDGSYRWFRIRALPERDASGTLAEWVGTFTDIEEERRARQSLEDAVRLRDEFLIVASHELRTPLTALQLQLEGLARSLPDGDGPGSKMLALAQRQTRRLGRLVDSLLEVSRLRLGRFDLHLEEFDLADAARDVAERFREEAERQGCEIHFEADPAPGRWDRLRIEEVLTNLLSNAIKYGGGKPITLEVKERMGRAVVTVRDEGIGIEPAALPRIFERFERGVSSRHYGGLGLGLYIARQIVEAHGGSITADSHPGAGSTFSVTLPLEAVARRARPEDLPLLH